VKVLLLTTPEPEPHESRIFQRINLLLKQLGHEVVEHKADAALFENVIGEKPDVIFNLASIYAWNKTDLIPAVLEIADVPYTGSGILSLSLARNFTKLFPLLDRSGIRVVPFKIIKAGSAILYTELHFPLNLLLDGVRQKLVLAAGSELKKALQDIPPQAEVVLQQQLTGEKLSFYILGSAPFLSSMDKSYLTPALEIYRLIEARGLVRFDFILADEPLLYGIDTAPDPLDDELLTMAAQFGWSEMDVIRSLLEHAAIDREPSSPNPILTSSRAHARDLTRSISNHPTGRSPLPSTTSSFL